MATAFLGTGALGAREPRGTVSYSKRGVRIAEVYFDRLEDTTGADIVRYQNFSRPVDGTISAEAPTLHVDLRPSPDDIAAQMRRRARRKLKAAEEMDLVYQYDFSGSAAWMAEFCDFFDRFAPLKKLPPANRERIEGLRQAGVLFLSRISEAGANEPLVWHCYYFVDGVARMFHSASLFRGVKDESGEVDREFAHKVADANGYLHWCDMLQAKQMGCHTYDFGSWYEGADAENLRINEFKEGFGGQVVRLYSADVGKTLKGIAACYGRQLQGVLRGGR